MYLDLLSEYCEKLEKMLYALKMYVFSFKIRPVMPQAIPDTDNDNI